MAEESNESWLLLLCKIPVLGDLIPTVGGLWPLGLSLWLLGGSPGLAMVLGGLVLAPWLIFLERWQLMRINVPYLPIKWLWLTPLIILGGAATFF